MDPTFVKSGLDFQVSEDAALKVHEVIGFVKQFEDTTEEEKSFCTQHFARAMAVNYVYNLNIGERIGTQTEEDTKEIIDRLLSQKSTDRAPTLSTEQLETQNTYLGLKQFEDIRKEMEYSGLLTVNLICDVHKTLMKGIKEQNNCGVVRKSDVYTHWDGSIHYYPPADKVEDLFYRIIDHHNLYMDSVANMEIVEKVSYIFRCAAWLLFTFVDIHPFVDGNGRLCRLLANHVLSLITPFPINAYCPSGKEGNDRQCYIEAIVECRKSSARHPVRLCEMLIGSALASWTNLFSILGQLRKWKVVPIDIRQGSGKIKECVFRALPKDVDRHGADTSAVEEAIRKADVTGLQSHQCVPISSIITVGEAQFPIHLCVFPPLKASQHPIKSGPVPLHVQ